MFGKKSRLIREQKNDIEQLQVKISELEKEKAALQEQVDSYVQRELAIVSTLTEASLHAQRIKEEAQKEGDQLREDARRELYLSQKKGEDVVEAAQRSARDIVKEAERQKEVCFRQTDESLSAYTELLSDFNGILRQQAKEARENAQRYESFCAKLAGDFPLLLQKLPRLADGSFSSEALPKVSDLVTEDSDSLTTDELLDTLLPQRDETVHQEPSDSEPTAEPTAL